MKNKDLTKKEKLVFDYLVKAINENGFAPSVRDIVADLGIKSTSSVHLYLHNLEAKGFIEQDANKKRTIRICSPYARVSGKVPLLGAITAGSPILAVENIEDLRVWAHGPLDGSINKVDENVIESNSASECRPCRKMV